MQWYWDRDKLAAALAEHGSRNAVAEATGVSGGTLQTWISRHKLSSGNARTPGDIAVAQHARGQRNATEATPAEPHELVVMRRRVERAEAQSKSLAAQLKHATKHANIVEDVRDMLAPVVAACVLPRPQRLARPPKRAGKPLTFVLHLSDIHWGEIVESATLNGVNAYNPDIAAMRLQHAMDTVHALAETYGARHDVDELVIAVNGDTIGGDLHPDSAEYYARAGRQMLDASLILSQISHEAAARFRIVRYLGTVGNHPRTKTRQPTGSARVETSWEWAMHHQVAALMANTPNVSFEIAQGYTLLTDIGPSRWAFAHGDAARGGGGSLGIPAYGLKRGHDSNREWSLVLAQLEELTLDTIVRHSRFGHFHTFFAWQAGAADIVLAPSPKGVDPFVKDELGKYSPPQLLLEVVHPEHDIIAQHPINLTGVGAGESRYLWNKGPAAATTPEVMRDWSASQ